MRRKRQRRRATVSAIGPDGWPCAERPVECAIALIVEQVADELRSAVRSDTSWVPRIVVHDHDGNDITAEFNVN